jgi:ferredoxin
MKTEIYYFTASGKSLAVARDVAKKISGRLISIPSVLNQERICSNASIIGIVFPVYYAVLGESGVPMIIERFIERLENIASKYIFAICTHDGSPVKTLAFLERMINSQGGKLSSGIDIKTGNPYSPVEKIAHFFFHKKLHTDLQVENEERQKIFNACEEKLESICKTIELQKAFPIKTQLKGNNRIHSLFYGLQNKTTLQRYKKLSLSSKGTLRELIPLADASFYFDKNCTGCGTCAKVCPVNNIELIDQKPVWQHHCETCFACFQWCPKAAIHGNIVEYEKRYHHPQVKLMDMLT